MNKTKVMSSGEWQIVTQKAVRWPCGVCGIGTHTTHNRFTALWILSGTTRVSRYQKKHSPTHTHRGHQSSLSASSIYYDPWHPPYSIHMLYRLFPQSLQVFFDLLHTFLHPIIIFFSQHMPIPSQPVLLYYRSYVI